MDEVYDVIMKNWKDKKGCPKAHDGRHWAYYVFQDEKEQEYWLRQRIDETNHCYWRHYEFMSIPCAKCGAYSPLRCCNQFSTNVNGEFDKKTCSGKEITNCRPNDELPSNILRYKEKGWTYYFFRKTLSDSLCGQETYRLRKMPPRFLSEQKGE